MEHTNNNSCVRTYVIGAVIAAAMIFLDQVTKLLAVSKLKNQDAFVILKGVFELHYLENRGAAFGILQNQRVVFVILTIIYLTAVFWFLHRCPKTGRYTLLHIIASVLTAGALGNFIDRLRLGYVVDFFYFSLINFPVFNVADIFVVISFIGIAVSILFIYKDDEFEFLSIRKRESKA